MGVGFAGGLVAVGGAAGLMAVLGRNGERGGELGGSQQDVRDFHVGELS